MSTFAPITVKLKNTEQVNSNNKLKDLGVGTHEVVLTGVVGQGESRYGSPQISLTFQSLDGERVFTDKYFNLLYDAGEGPGWSYKYKSLTESILPEAKTMWLETFWDQDGILAQNQNLWPKLEGVKLGVEIAPPKKGYQIKESGGSYVITDVESGEPPVVPGNPPTSFQTVKEAYDSAREYGLSLAYNRVKKFFPLKDSNIIKENKDIVISLLDSEQL